MMRECPGPRHLRFEEVFRGIRPLPDHSTASPPEIDRIARMSDLA
jgi:hypothetical protein